MQRGHYLFIDQERVTFGEPFVDAILEIAERRRADRLFLVSSKTLSRATPAVDVLRRALGNRFAGLFDETVAHTPRESVIRAAEAVRAAGPDLIVTLGGGTAIDTVKTLLLCLAEDIRTAEELGAYRIRVQDDGAVVRPETRPPPIRQVAVPTTLSAAEFSELAGVSDPVRQVKDIFCGRGIGAQEVVLDPAITLHAPDWLWISTGIRAIDHAVETICSRTPQPFTDATALHALGMLSRSLPINHRDRTDLAARLESQMAAWLASTGLGRVEWGASHGIVHQLGTVAGVPHGHASCVMLPAVMRYNEPVCKERQRLISRAMGAPDDAAADVVQRLLQSLGLPTRLREVGVERGHFDAIAQGAMENMMVRSNPRPIDDPRQVLAILESAW